MLTSKKSSQNVLLLAVLGSLIFINLLSMRHFFRFDLTNDKRYTLSQASIETVRKLDDMVTISAYFTDGLPAPYSGNARFVRDLLEEYRAKSNGKLAFEVVDPSVSETAADKEKKKDASRDIFGRVMREATSVEKELHDLGVQPVEIRILADEGEQSKRVYMGLVVHYQDKHEVVPVVQDVNDLERNLTTLMHKLTRPKTPVLGLLQLDKSVQISKLHQLLAPVMELKDLDTKTPFKIPENVDGLLLMGQKSLVTDEMAAEIGRFVGTNKAAALLLDEYNIDLRSLRAQPLPSSGGGAALDAWLAKLGVSVGSQLVADKHCVTLPSPDGRQLIYYPFIPAVTSFAANNVMTKGLSGVLLPFVSPVNVDSKFRKSTQALLLSSKGSWLEKSPPNIAMNREWRQEDIQFGGPYTLMAQGMLPKAGRVLVAGSSAMLWDPFLTEPNQVLAYNMADWLVGDPALIAMRSRQFTDVPLSPDSSDMAKSLARYGNMVGWPLLLILFGIVHWRLRESKRKQMGIGL